MSGAKNSVSTVRSSLFSGLIMLAEGGSFFDERVGPSTGVNVFPKAGSGSKAVAALGSPSVITQLGTSGSYDKGC